MKKVDYSQYHKIRRAVRKYLQSAILEAYPITTIFKRLGIWSGRGDKTIVEAATRWWDEGNEKMAVLLIISWYYSSHYHEPILISYSKKAKICFWMGIRPSSMICFIRTNFLIGERN